VPTPANLQSLPTADVAASEKVSATAAVAVALETVSRTRYKKSIWKGVQEGSGRAEHTPIKKQKLWLHYCGGGPPVVYCS
jgi:hypothetical protein